MAMSFYLQLVLSLLPSGSIYERMEYEAPGVKNVRLG